MRITTFKHRAKLLAGLLLLAVGSTASAAVTDSFTATYDVSYGFIGLGQLTFELRPADQPGCYVYAGQGDPNAVVAMLIGSLSDKTRFCITDKGNVQPLFFRHHEQGDPEDSYTLTFDWPDSSVRYQNRDGNIRVMPLPETATDPLSLQIAARLWLEHAAHPAQLPNKSFTLVDENEIKHYTLAVEAGGTIEVPAGRYDTLIVKRVDNGDEQLRFWLAKYADWVPVRVEYTQDGRTITMELTQITWH